MKNIKNIIKEHLKKLINEQSSNLDPSTNLPINYNGGTSPYPGSGPNGETWRVRIKPCGSPAQGGGGLSLCVNLTGIPGGSPQIGQAFTLANVQGLSTNWFNNNPASEYYIDAWSGVGNYTPGQPACMVNPSGGYSTLAYSSSTCPSTSGTACPACDAGQNTWANASNWQNTFTTNMQNAPWFNNAGQPCQFLQNRVAHFTQQQSGINNCVTSAQYNMLECKKKYIISALYPQYNC